MNHRALLLVLLAACGARAEAQPSPEPLYELDTAAQPAPPAGSRLDRILATLQVRICIRADVAPFGSFHEGRLQGFDVALAHELVDQLSIDYKQALQPAWVIVAAADRVKRLQEDACDLMLGAFSYTKERAAQVATTKVYARTDKVLVAAAKITRTPPVIGKLEGATGDAGIAGTTRSYRTYQEIIHALDGQELDYLAADRPIADQLVRSTAKPYSVTKTLAAGAESYVAAVRNGEPQLLGAIDRALETLARSGRLALLERRWL